MRQIVQDTSQTTTADPAEPTDRHAGSVHPDDYRAALSRLAGGVVLVTAHDPEDGPRGEDVGMTATAFMSVSLDPPLVTVSVRNDSRMEELLSRQPLWAVSVLSESQRHIAGRFAMRGRISDRLLFEDIPYYRGEESGAPILGGALAVLECRTEQLVPAGDHTLAIGLVLAAQTPSADGGPLAYFRGKYRYLSK
ncbi:reductase [Wenjunlia tyrosinilytica]|uniref:Reductase n=1 Tax=Wenjunlia tyrosinilytica TaxID=1544741 RepID=A0A918DWP6_9ACTN|nr:reductase [Wenjunlia tyrosinilytica]